MDFEEDAQLRGRVEEDSVPEGGEDEEEEDDGRRGLGGGRGGGLKTRSSMVGSGSGLGLGGVGGGVDLFEEGAVEGG